jgi:hypothetical protein
MYFIAVFTLIGLLAAAPAAPEKVQEATGAVAPKSDVGEKRAQSAQRKASADWISADGNRAAVRERQRDRGEPEQQRRAESGEPRAKAVRRKMTDSRSRRYAAYQE